MKKRVPRADIGEAEVQRRIAMDSDNPELTETEIAGMKPFREMLPDLAATMEREIAKRGRPKLDNPKEAVTLRLDPATVKKFKASGNDWRSRMGRILDKAKV